ncbi:endo-1,4-beta-xylanase [Acidicapsa dinghuensis]|uniref:Beta-xylanase n=1 Tax=Acidicapsa dinghuensis TaxID=2218256 RepID=A0ABW1EJ30_9BACT|nr:endo-1,4-beta-xylanase [Acidicapsa dinghuensis]
MSRLLWTRRRFSRMAAAAALCPPLLAERRFAPASGPDVNGPNSLRAHGAAAGVLTGCAVVPELLDFDQGNASPDAEAYTRTVAEQAGILVAENAMKWSSLRPTASTYNFTPADKLFAFAAAYQQQVRGHNLCWHEQLPAWFSSVATKDNAASLLTQHIQTVAGRYAGRVHSWDVVNEAVYLQDSRPDGLRNSPWLQLIGPSYIELAFTAAAKADPHAKLTYNDYDIELDTPEQTAKRGQVLLLVRRLVARGIPIQAIGIQSHLQATGPKPGSGLLSLIREVAKLGLEVYITEMDVNTHQLEGGSDVQDAAVAEVYKSYLGMVLAEPNVKAFLTWGITDAHTWLNQIRQPWTIRPDGSRQRPLPFDDEYRPTPAFFAIRSAIDTARRPVSQPSSNAPQQPVSDPYAPFAVPGSPGTAPQPRPDGTPKPDA